MADKKIAFSVSSLFAAGGGGRRFVNDHGKLTGHFEKRKLIQETIQLGQVVREAGLSGLLALVDTPSYEMLNPYQRREAIRRYLDMLDGSNAGLTSVEPSPASVAPKQTVSVPDPVPDAPPAPETKPEETETRPETAVAAPKGGRLGAMKPQ